MGGGDGTCYLEPPLALLVRSFELCVGPDLRLNCPKLVELRCKSLQADEFLDLPEDMLGLFSDATTTPLLGTLDLEG